MMIKEKIKIICKRGKEEYLIVDKDNPQLHDEARIYDNHYNKLSHVYTFGQITKGGYWKRCENDKEILKKVLKVL